MPRILKPRNPTPRACKLLAALGRPVRPLFHDESEFCDWEKTSDRQLLKKIKPKTSPIPPEQEAFIKWKQTQLWTVEHDRIQTLVSRLVPGTFLVSNEDSCEDFRDSLSRGRVLPGVEIRVPNIFNDRINMKVMDTARCHDNCDKLLRQKKIQTMITGWALSDDGLWRWHSWGIDRRGGLVETTLPRLVYLSVFAVSY